MWIMVEFSNILLCKELRPHLFDSEIKKYSGVINAMNFSCVRCHYNKTEVLGFV